MMADDGFKDESLVQAKDACITQSR